MLYWQEFEDLVRALGVRLFGAGLTSFKAGKDGGRDARFDGTPEAWPSKTNQIPGQYVLQSKHTGNAVACCSDSDFKSHMKGEVKKVRILVSAKEMSHYLVFTNRTKSAAEDQDFRTTFAKIKGVQESWLLGTEHISSLLTDHSDIWDRYEEEVRTPVRFNRDDLVKIIHDFSDFMKQVNGLPHTASLRHLKLEEKNKLNGITAPYFSDLQRHSMPQCDQIRTFLSNPRNEEHLDLYRDTADDLRGRLRTMLNEGIVEKLEDGFERVRQDFIATDDRLQRKKRWVRVFLDYMYSNCDIGQNVDSSQASET